MNFYYFQISERIWQKKAEFFLNCHLNFQADGKPVDATQEMLAIGACNIVSAFVHSMPVSGGLSRGAVNHSSGVKTTLGGVYTGILVLVSLQFFTPYLYYIPKAALAAVIIAAVVFMVELQVIKPMWRTKSEFQWVFHKIERWKYFSCVGSSAICFLSFLSTPQSQ